MFRPRQQPIVGTADHSRRRSLPTWAWAGLAALVSGGLLAVCYEPLDLGFVAWLALVPWLVVLPWLSPAKTWLFGILLGLCFYRLGLAWLLELAGPLGGAAIVVLAVWMGFSFRVARLLMDRFGSGAMLWAVPICWVGQEVLRCEGLPHFRFAFLALGYSQSHNLWIAQIVSLGGVYFLSLLIVAFNASLAHGLLHRRPRAWLPACSVLTIALVLGVVSQPSAEAGGDKVTVACVQGEDLPYRDFIKLTNQAAAASPKPDFVVLPEHTITETTVIEHRFSAQLAQVAREQGLYICVGAHLDAPAGAACDYDNVAMLIGPDGGIIGTQAKAVPLPFFNDGNPARSQVCFDTNRGRIGMCVCYDAIFTDLPRRLSDQGAELLLVPVMDASRWPIQERRQHADMAPFRSIELRRCAVRAASSGISQIIDASGRVVAQRSQDEGPSVIVASGTLRADHTLFARGGYLAAPIIGWLFLSSIATLTAWQWGRAIRSAIRGRAIF